MKKNENKKGISQETKALLIDLIGLVAYALLYGFLYISFETNPNLLWITFGVSAAYCAIWYYLVDRKTGGLLYTGILLAMASMLIFRQKGVI